MRIVRRARGARLLLLLPLTLPAAGLSGQAAGELSLEPLRLAVAGSDSIAAERGTLRVQENRSRPDSRTIELAFVRLRSDVPDPAPPLIYLAGGPGGSSTQFADSPETLRNWTSYLRYGDVIFLDQRGAGASGPDLLFIDTSVPPADILIDPAVARARAIDQARRGGAHFREQGIDLDGYTTVESADDIDDLRAALGLEQVRLFGFSYGTHLALATIRRHGERIERAILMGTEGPDHTLKLPLTMDTQLEKIAREVARDPRISGTIPDFMALLDRVMAQLDREPMEVEVRDPVGRTLRVAVGSLGLRFLLRFDVGDASDIPVFPRLLYSIEQGDPSVLTWFVQRRARTLYGTQVMSLIMDGASGASPGRLAIIRAQAERSRFADVVNTGFPETGEAAGAPDLGDAYRSPILSDVPALFLSGTLDFNTPPFQAEEVRWGFPRSAHVIVKNAGHEQIIRHPAVHEAIDAFLAGEEVSDRLADAGPLRFVPLEGYDPEVTHPSVPRP